MGRGSGNGDFSSNGQHEEQNNYMLDGADNNTMNSDYINGSTYSIAPPPDAIAEFKMETSNYSAEIGRGHGAVINATTKSGTNANSRGSLGVQQKHETRRAGLDSGPRLDPGGVPHESIWRYPGRADHQEQAVFLWRHPGCALRRWSESEHIYVPTPRMRQGDFTRTSESDLEQGSCPTVLYVPNTNTGTYTSAAATSVTGQVPTGTLQQYGSQRNIRMMVYTFAAGQNVFSPAQLDTVAQKLIQAFPCPNYAAAGQPNYGSRMADGSTGNCNAETTLDTGPDQTTTRWT